MKKIFLCGIIAACSTATFAQNSTSQPVKKNNTAPSLREAQEAKAKKENTSTKKEVTVPAGAKAAKSNSNTKTK